jgi:hypothetical protein
MRLHGVRTGGGVFGADTRLRDMAPSDAAADAESEGVRVWPVERTYSDFLLTIVDTVQRVPMSEPSLNGQVDAILASLYTHFLLLVGLSYEFPNVQA